MFYFWEILPFLYYENEEIDDVIGGSSYKTQSRISSEILGQCSSNLAPETYITKERE